MSASNKKKLRKQEAQAQMTDRQTAAAKEAKKQKTFTLTFWVVMVLCVCITIGALLTNPVKNVVYRNTVAVEVGDYTLSAVELNYFYIDAINTFTQQYSSYLSYMLSTTTPLDDQVYDKETGESWADYFVSQAEYNIQSTYAVYDLAVSENYTLSDDAKKELENTMTYMSLYASIYGYSSVDAYLAAIYGNGATEESYRAYYEKCMIAEYYYNDYSDSLEYNAEALATYQKDIEYQFNSYTYAYYYLAANRFYPEGAGGEDGKTYTDEEKAAAIEAAQAAADSLAAGEYIDLDAFDAAINSLPVNQEDEESDTTEDSDKTKTTTEGESEEEEKTEGEDNTEGEEEEEEEEKPTYKYSSTKKENVLYSKVSALFQDWLSGKIESENEDEDPTFEIRTEGDLTVIPYTTGEGEDEVINGYYVVRFGSIEANEFVMKNVRHLLVKFEKANSSSSSSSSSSSNTSYTKEEKMIAKTEAEKLLKEWLDGEATEETFIELVKKNSDDNAEAGGLYENVYPGLMVEAFENWCYDENRKVGDYEIIETEYGYHIMYFVGDTEQTYRDYLITETIRAEDVEKWYNALVEAIKVSIKTDKYVEKDMTIG